MSFFAFYEDVVFGHHFWHWLSTIRLLYYGMIYFMRPHYTLHSVCPCICLSRAYL